MMDHNQAEPILVDYVLDLLPAAERRRVEVHLAGCANCRAAVQQERSLVRAVHQVFDLATQPAPGRLDRFRDGVVPTGARPGAPASSLINWSRQLFAGSGAWRWAAAFCLLLLFAAGSLNQEIPAGGGSIYATGASIAVTATQTPTYTATTPPQALRLDPGRPLPPLSGTPVAALPQNAGQQK